MVSEEDGTRATFKSVIQRETAKQISNEVLEIINSRIKMYENNSTYNCYNVVSEELDLIIKKRIEKLFKEKYGVSE